MYPKYWIQAHGPKSNIAVAGPNSHTLSHLHHQQLLKSTFVITRFQNKKQTKKWTRGKYPVYYILFPSLTLTFSFYHHCNSVKKYSHRNLTPTHTHNFSFSLSLAASLTRTNKYRSLVFHQWRKPEATKPQLYPR